jgi:hypothetical protein
MFAAGHAKVTRGENSTTKLLEMAIYLKGEKTAGLRTDNSCEAPNVDLLNLGVF